MVVVRGQNQEESMTVPGAERKRLDFQSAESGAVQSGVVRC